MSETWRCFYCFFSGEFQLVGPRFWGYGLRVCYDTHGVCSGTEEGSGYLLEIELRFTCGKKADILASYWLQLAGEVGWDGA